MTLSYLTGDATQPIKKPALIMHVCNDIGRWGRGFVLALSKRWPAAERHYRGLTHYDLGMTHMVRVDADVLVANMIAQSGIHRNAGVPPIRYDALARCLEAVNRFTEGKDYTIHAPRIGAGLSGGDWVVIEALIEKILKDRDVYIYDLPEPQHGRV